MFKNDPAAAGSAGPAELAAAPVAAPAGAAVLALAEQSAALSALLPAPKSVSERYGCQGPCHQRRQSPGTCFSPAYLQP